MEHSAEFIPLIGRLHLVLLHLPIGFIVLLAALELLSMKPRWRHATLSNRFVLFLTAPVAVLTAICGWVLAGTAGYDERLLFLHRWTGVGVAVATSLLLGLHLRGWLSLYRFLIFATLGLTIVAGHFGASLTHGRGYLTKGTLPWVSNGKENGAMEDRDSGKFGQVEPVFSEFCVGCHGPERAKGGLRLESLNHVLAGGDSGPVLVPGDPEGSLLIRRMELPLEQDDHMPPEGKPQPTHAQIDLIRNWIRSGTTESMNRTP